MNRLISQIISYLIAAALFPLLALFAILLTMLIEGHELFYRLKGVQHQPVTFSPGQLSPDEPQVTGGGYGHGDTIHVGHAFGSS